jgi:hypothetical protein
MERMCGNCWEKAGAPTTWNDQIARAVELLGDLYAIHATGGPLHVAVDDYNLDGTIEPYWGNWDDEELDAVYYAGFPIDSLPPTAPAVVEGLGRSTRQICEELAALLNAMPEADRYAAVARYDGYWTEADRD